MFSGYHGAFEVHRDSVQNLLSCDNPHSWGHYTSTIQYSTSASIEAASVASGSHIYAIPGTLGANMCKKNSR